MVRARSAYHVVVGGAPHITLSVCWTACTSIQKIRWAPIAFWSTCFNSVFFFVSGQHDTTRGGGEEGQPHGHLSSCWRLPHAIKTKVAIPKKLYLGFVVNEGLCTNLFVWLIFTHKKITCNPILIYINFMPPQLSSRRCLRATFF